MPAVINSRRPRVLRRNPDCRSLILNDWADDVHKTELSKSNHECAQSRRYPNGVGYERKHRKRKTSDCKIDMDMQTIVSLENFCDTRRKVNDRLDQQVTCLRQASSINGSYNLPVPKIEPNNIVNDPRFALYLHQSDLNRLPKSPEVSSQNSCPSRFKNNSISDCGKQEHRLDSEWFVGESEKSLIDRRLKNNLHNIQRWEKRTINNSKKYSYFQFALLCFLFAFGHSSVTRSSFSGIVTFGTIFCAPTWAAPINSLEATNRSERSANLSHVSGTSRWIRMFIRNRYLQILPDGTVNGTDNDNSIYTILQRITVATAQLQIKASATCLYLCMDSCGLLYGSSNVTENCIFKENILTNGYNYYSSVSGSGPHKNLLIALDRFGHSRKLKVHTNNFGKRINYARALTMTAPPKQMAALRAYIEETLQNQDKIRHARNVRHEFSLQQKFCATLIGLEGYIRDNTNCKKQPKRRKKKRAPSGCKGIERRGVFCGSWPGSLDSTDSGEVSSTSKTSCEDATSNVLCKKQLRNVSSKKRKSRLKVSKGDERSQPRRKHMIQEIIKTPMPVEVLKDLKKSPGIIKQQKKPEQKRTSSKLREKLAEKMLRATLPPWRNSDVTLPAMYSMPTSSSTWETSRIHKSSTYFKNAVTTAAKPGLINKPQFSSEISLESNSSLLSSPFEVSEDISLAASSDLSIEDSGESISLGDNESTSSIDCVTLMTTMDTTPPERTEDYMKTTTQSTLNAFDAKFNHFINRSNYTAASEDKILHKHE